MALTTPPGPPLSLQQHQPTRPSTRHLYRFSRNRPDWVCPQVISTLSLKPATQDDTGAWVTTVLLRSPVHLARLAQRQTTERADAAHDWWERHLQRFQR